MNIRLIVGLILLTIPLHADPLILDQITDLPKKWSSSHQLYLKGNIPVSENALKGLEEWLKQHPHWTVVLADTARDESYTKRDGTTITGNAVVSEIMGKVLPSGEAGLLVDSRTHLSNYASLVIQLKDGHLNYAASSLQNRYGVGINQWPKNLDQPAIQAMQQGHRIVDAVKNTITNIDQKIETRMAQEIARPVTSYTTAQAMPRVIYPQRRDSLDFTFGFILVGIIFLVLGMGAGFVFFSQLRRVAQERSKCQKQLAAWQQALKAKTDGLFNLDSEIGALALDAQDPFGSAAKLYTGETLQSVTDLLKNKDRLFIMSSYLKDVYNRAQALANENSFSNLFFTEKYERAMLLLKSEPIIFRHDDPLKLLNSDSQKAGGLLGRPEDYEEFTRTADQLLNEFDNLVIPVQKTLETIRTSSERIKALKGQEEDLKKTLGEDYPLPTLNLEEMETLALKDPISAIRQLEKQVAILQCFHETRQGILAMETQDLSCLKPAQRDEISAKRNEIKMALKAGKVEEASVQLQQLTELKNGYLNQWETLNRFIHDQPEIHARYQAATDQSTSQPWVQPASIQRAQELLNSAQKAMEARAFETAQKGYQQVEVMQQEWHLAEENYHKAQSELARVRQQLSQSTLGQEQLRQAEYAFQTGNYDHTFMYTAMALEAFESMRLQEELAAQQRYQQPVIIEETSNQWAADSSGSASSSFDPGDSPGTGDTSGSSGSDF